MTTLNQTQTQKTVHQQDDKPLQKANSGDVKIPESWQLTNQQKDFIELFSTDDHIEQ